MRKIALILLLTGAVVGAAAARAGSVTGKITYDGKVPAGARQLIQMGADPNCAAKHGAPVYTEDLVLGSGNRVANAFIVVIQPAGSRRTPTSPAVVALDGCMYRPHAAAVVVGQPLRFKNLDGIPHRVHGLPKVNREFNIGMPPSVTETTVRLSRPERPFAVECDVHPWERVYVGVMTHPYFAVTGTNGTYTIDGLHPGSYQIEAWHERLGTQRTTVELTGPRATADFSFKP